MKIVFICLIQTVIQIILMIVLLSKRIAKPIYNLSLQADKITNFDLNTVEEVKSSIQEIQKLQHSITRMRKSLASFAKFVPGTLVKKLLDSLVNENTNIAQKAALLSLWRAKGETDNETTVT